MSTGDVQKKRGYQQKYRETHREQLREANRKDYAAHRDQRREYNQAWWNSHKEHYHDLLRQRRIRLKEAALDAYGGRVCVCCEEAHLEFLTLDHIMGGGSKHRSSVSHWGNDFYRWLKLQDYPPGYRVLCMNCNFALGKHGYCPHNKTGISSQEVSYDHTTTPAGCAPSGR